MGDMYTLSDAVITIDMDSLKVTATWQVPPPAPLTVENVTHIVTLDMGKAVVEDLRPPPADSKATGETKEGR